MKLNQLSEILKSKEILVGLFLVLGLVTIVLFLWLGTKQVGWNDKIFPGKTDVKKLKEILGEPLRVQEKADRKIYYFDSGNKFRPNSVEVQENKVVLVIEPIIKSSKGELSRYKQNLADKEQILYGKYGSGTPAYIWPRSGILIFGNEETKEIFEIWYFKPMKLEKFIQTYPEFSLTPKEIF